ncbi:MAG: hypothetical protein BGO70_08365 [Bacteroidetes bacterium 43-93]|nr:DUF4279 domain-containing protein [Bacteroidota bacterium]OJW97778.1 MAG: hypothetical protein BGO70_08365 [Bacteroidetes bacterium 43-93]
MTELEKQFREIAINEIRNADLGVTEQFLEIHEIEYEGDNPKILYVHLDSNTHGRVYFAVKDEYFYFCVYTRIEPEPKAYWSDSERSVHLSFVANSENLSSADLASLTALIPTTTWEKGQIRHNIPHRTSGINFIPNEEPDTLDNKLLHLLDFLESDKSGIDAVIKAADYTCIFATIDAHNGNEHIHGVYLEPPILKRLADLDVSIDFDFYARGNLYKNPFA